MSEFGDVAFGCRRQRFLICANRLLIAVLLLTNTTQANWWYLGLSSSAFQSTENSPKSSHYKDKCSEQDVLSEHQKEICARARNVLPVVSRGASMAIDECQYQFRNRRWNCTTFEQKTVFGNILVRNSREKAYIYAISSAGVTHSITKACAKGEVQMCSCDLNVRNQEKEVDFMWGGCSHDVRFGEKFSKEFVDGRESSDQNLEERLMNRWNNEAGRKTVSGNMKLLCKCHGVSGSCSAKICWRTVASFREIGDLLKDKFDGATRVKVIATKLKLKPVDRRQKKPTRRDLVYLEQSPDYCDYRPEVGSLGTVGRQCNRTSYGLDGCQLMCCGRGYRTYVEEEVEDCNCKFFWCCSVECQKCSSHVEKYYCN